ncbi:hypothetical protein SBA4_2940013 [Candidatus Sulfopaludibacter sp. SbA4]|nr:hypothetical protein SBA4_2940013 [Candidatus Sulfopaludibacter sp. SbA4]
MHRRFSRLLVESCPTPFLSQGNPSSGGGTHSTSLWSPLSCSVRFGLWRTARATVSKLSSDLFDGCINLGFLTLQAQKSHLKELFVCQHLNSPSNSIAAFIIHPSAIKLTRTRTVLRSSVDRYVCMLKRG